MYICICMGIYLYVDTHTDIFVYTYIHTYIHTCIHILGVYIYIYIYIHTYTCSRTLIFLLKTVIFHDDSCRLSYHILFFFMGERVWQMIEYTLQVQLGRSIFMWYPLVICYIAIENCLISRNRVLSHWTLIFHRFLQRFSTSMAISGT